MVPRGGSGFCFELSGTIWPMRNCSLIFALVPANNGFRDAVGGREIRLDVEKPRAVQAIQPDDRKPVTIDAQQLDDAHRHRIWPGRRAQCECAALDAMVRRHLQHEVPRRSVHPVQKDNVAASLNVLQRFFPARIDIDNANCLGFARVFRTILAVLPRRVNTADEVKTGVGAGRKFDCLSPSRMPKSLVVIELLQSTRAFFTSSIGRESAGKCGTPSHKDHFRQMVSEGACRNMLKRIKISLYSWKVPIWA